jgi:hypothetical protein
LKIIVYLEAQGKETKEYPIFEGELDQDKIQLFRRELRKTVTKTHCKVELNNP